MGEAELSNVEQKYYERLKVVFLAVIFFCVVGAYTITKELKDSVLLGTLGGKEYIPWVKWLVMFALMPAILLYSRLVDSLRRYQLLLFYSIVFAILNLVFAYLIGHPRIGLNNTDTGPYRILGWIFYLFVESYSPFIVSVFWAFANSVNSPQSAKNSYGFMVSGSKLGGMVGAGIGWMWFSWSGFSDAINHQFALTVSSFFLICVAISVLFLIKKVPGKYLHGYEAVYKVEKKKQKEGTAKTGMFAGLAMFFKYPYVLGIFGMVFFYESIQTVLGYLRVGVAQSYSQTLSGAASYLFASVFFMHAVGFVISLVGTSMLMRTLGERKCLLLIPLCSGLFLLAFMFYPSPYVLGFVWVGIKSINYAFSWPVRESLYIPTVKAIKFKSKSWIDAFGSKFAKSTGSSFNLLASKLSSAMVLPFHSFLFACLTGLWFGTAYLLGSRFENAVENNEVIGQELE